MYRTVLSSWRASIASILQRILPKGLYDCAQSFLRRRREERFKRQKLVRLRCGDFDLSVPENHILTKVSRIQPYRNLCVGLAAGFVSRKYPEKWIIDVGANIGDTAAMIASHSKNGMILVEPDEYFYQILSLNCAQIPNETKMVQALLFDGTEVQGAFQHWGGTARFNESSNGRSRMATIPLSEVTKDEVGFIKVDADGFDFRILRSSMTWLSSAKPAVLFENEIRNSSDLDEANNLFKEFMESGYAYFVFWDDPGMHVVSTRDLGVIRNLNRYMWKVWQDDARKTFYSYNVLALHEQDSDIYAEITDWYGNY